jgi:hypothetical protein
MSFLVRSLSWQSHIPLFFYPRWTKYQPSIGFWSRKLTEHHPARTPDMIRQNLLSFSLEAKQSQAKQSQAKPCTCSTGSTWWVMLGNRDPCQNCRAEACKRRWICSKLICITLSPLWFKWPGCDTPLAHDVLVDIYAPRAFPPPAKVLHRL